MRLTEVVTRLDQRVARLEDRTDASREVSQNPPPPPAPAGVDVNALPPAPIQTLAQRAQSTNRFPVLDPTEAPREATVGADAGAVSGSQAIRSLDRQIRDLQKRNPTTSIAVTKSPGDRPPRDPDLAFLKRRFPNVPVVLGAILLIVGAFSTWFAGADGREISALGLTHLTEVFSVAPAHRDLWLGIARLLAFLPGLGVLLMLWEVMNWRGDRNGHWLSFLAGLVLMAVLITFAVVLGPNPRLEPWTAGDAIQLVTDRMHSGAWLVVAGTGFCILGFLWPRHAEIPKSWPRLRFWRRQPPIEVYGIPGTGKR